MGYPMTYSRFVKRNLLEGDYDPEAGQKPLQFDPRPILRGDLRRLEQDQRDDRHLAEYAKVAGITPEQAKAVLDHFFRMEW